VDLPAYRAFVLSEGSMNKNNSHLFFVNPETDETYATDIFEAQNGIKLGDTANDILAADGNIYVLVNVSKVIYRLNGSGVLQATYKDFDADDLGEPRYMVMERGKLYVTCYGGYVARLDAKTLAYEAKVKTDANPEEIIAYGGQLFCVCSGMGTGNTLCIIDRAKFDKAESVQTLDNPYAIKEANGHIYALEQANGVNTAQHEAALVQSFRTLCRSTNTYSWERMTYACKEAAFLRQRTRI
jgi:hypothetical protein